MSPSHEVSVASRRGEECKLKLPGQSALCSATAIEKKAHHTAGQGRGQHSPGRQERTGGPEPTQALTLILMLWPPPNPPDMVTSPRGCFGSHLQTIQQNPDRPCFMFSSMTPTYKVRARLCFPLMNRDLLVRSDYAVIVFVASLPNN